MLSFFSLSIAFLPFIPYDVSLIILLIGRYFINPITEDLSLALLIQIISVDIFFFLEKKKANLSSFYCFLVSFFYYSMGLMIRLLLVFN